LKKIAIITTGGTIGSCINGDTVTLNTSSDNNLFSSDFIEKYNIDIINAITISSEDTVPSDWIDILHAIKAANENPEYKGIVLTHGTDTMAYTLSVLSSYNNMLKKPLCVTGSFYAPNHPKSDAYINLEASLHLVSKDNIIPSTYVAFRSILSNRSVKIAHGHSLIPMSFNDRSFNYTYHSFLGTYSKDNKKLNFNEDVNIKNNNIPLIESNKIPCIENIKESQKKIAIVKLYPGIDLLTLNAIAKSKDIMIIKPYHSGTGQSFDKGCLIEFLKTNLETKVFIGNFPSKYIQSPYESTIKLINAGASVYCDLQTHQLYSFSLLSLALGRSLNSLCESLEKWELKI